MNYEFINEVDGKCYLCSDGIGNCTTCEYQYFNTSGKNKLICLSCDELYTLDLVNNICIPPKEDTEPNTNDDYVSSFDPNGNIDTIY